MITQIEIDGFKTFKDFKVELAPFQVIVGPNGSGKSNLFDALQLLSNLARMDLNAAFQGLRGNANELFTQYPDGTASKRIRLAVEMLVDRTIQDAFSNIVEIKYRRLCYEVEIAVHDEDEVGRLSLVHEVLRSIPYENDAWSKQYRLSAENGWLSEFLDEKVFVESDSHHSNQIKVYLDDNSIIKAEFMFKKYSNMKETTLSTFGNRVFPSLHIYAVAKELQSLKILHLNPIALHKKSSTKAPRLLASDGGNLPTVLAHLQREDKQSMARISRTMASLVPGISRIRVELNKEDDEYFIQAKMLDQRAFSSRVLSDGTLRLLALVALNNDPQAHGIICVEEPENSVDSLHLSQMVDLLQGMATDFTDPEQKDEPLRQVIVTTHSPIFMALPEVVGSVLFTFRVTRVEPGKNSWQVTRMVPVLATDKDEEVATDAYTINQVRKYLDSGNFDETRERLSRARDAALKDKKE